MELSFDYRFYKKRCKYVCLRSVDEERHFTLLYVRPKDALTPDEWNKINLRLKKYLEEHNWTLTFTPWKACENCTYGHFDVEFENLICQIRREYPQMDTGHDLSFDGQHAHLVAEGCRRPVLAHISHRRGTNEKLSEFLRAADRNTTLTLKISVRQKRND